MVCVLLRIEEIPVDGADYYDVVIYLHICYRFQILMGPQKQEGLFYGIILISISTPNMCTLSFKYLYIITQIYNTNI